MLSFYTGVARATVDLDYIIGGAYFDWAAKLIGNVIVDKGRVKYGKLSV